MTSPQNQLDAHVRAMMKWHFSEETGTPFWIQWAKSHGVDPRKEVGCFDDLDCFGNFDIEQLRLGEHQDWIPRAFSGQPFKVFETGGTTGLPTQRLSWKDHLEDYERLSARLPEDVFPKGGNWLILGPTGPRRLRLSMEHLANYRGGSAYHVDLDPRWVRKCIQAGRFDVSDAYRDHVIAQAVPLIQHRDIKCIFTTPVILEALVREISLADHGVTGILAGGTSMNPQVVRFLIEELLPASITFQPVYGNTLMGLAISAPITTDNNFEVVYYAPQPRAVLRVVGEDGASVDYGERGRVELSTLTPEFFMPRHLERDEAILRPPSAGFEWDGLGDVRPLGSAKKVIVEGVY
jgi:hypothetical protein